MSRAAKELFERLGREFFDFDPETGVFRHNRRARHRFPTARAAATWNTRFTGKVVARQSHGYIYLAIYQIRVRAHHYAWFLTHGVWPKMIDHINGDPADNRPVNLREADESLNRMNMRRRVDNRSGVTGVCFNKQNGKWTAAITVRGKTDLIGRFASFDDAVAARLAAQRRYDFGPNHGSAPRTMEPANDRRRMHHPCAVCCRSSDRGLSCLGSPARVSGQHRLPLWRAARRPGRLNDGRGAHIFQHRRENPGPYLGGCQSTRPRRF